jgi:CRP/FNR family transcriptional regulator, cyclic AMP receptor protein
MSRKADINEVVSFLSRIRAFELLDGSHLQVLGRLIKVRFLEPEQVLWLQGQKITHFTIVYSGRLRSLRRSSSGSEKLVSILTPGKHFGLAEMITNAASTVTLIADEPTKLLILDHNSLRKELLSNAVICYRLMQTMGRAIFSLTRELERASFENVQTRLARVLLRFNDEKPMGEPDLNSSDGMTHKDLSVQLGVSRETISRTLADFKKRGLIETGYCHITVRDREGLMRFIEDFDQW